MDKLERIRNEALRKGILELDDDAWVKTKLLFGRQELRGRCRLKGDWTDHLMGDKWSFRINNTLLNK